MAFRELSKEVFETFHREFKGDTYLLCQPCGGCEYSLLAALLPGEAAYMASILANPMTLESFRKRYLDKILVDDKEVDMLRLVAPCPFLNKDGRCTIVDFKPILCEIYPLELKIDSKGELIAEIDSWCPLSKNREVVQDFRNKWRTVGHLLKDVDSKWVHCVEQFDPFTYDCRCLEKARNCPTNLPAKVKIQTVLKCRLQYIDAMEPRALFSHEEPWQKLQGELLHYLQAEFPGSICRSVRIMLESRDAKAKADSLTKAAESIVFLCAVFMVVHYTQALKAGDIDTPDTKLNVDILTNLRRASFGKLVEFARELSGRYIKWNMSHFVEELPVAWASRGEVPKLMADFVSIRNDIQHNRIKLTDESSYSIYSTNFGKFLRLVHELRFLHNYAIVSPTQKHGSTVDLLVSRGSGQNLLCWQEVSLVGNFNLGEVYLLNMQTREIMSLWPFYRLENCPVCRAPRFFRCELKSEKKVSMIDELDGHNLEIPTAEVDFPEFLEPLSPDYKFQKDLYLRGHSLRVLNHDWTSEIVNAHGDLQTTEIIQMQKIRFESAEEKSGNDSFMFDYHDCPDFPIDDETFALKATIDGKPCKPSSIIKTIWNPGFRKFGVDLGRRLVLEENVSLEVSMFEPELMVLWGDEEEDECIEGERSELSRDDYYEVVPAQPTEKLILKIIFPPGYRPRDLLLEHVGNGSMEIGKVLRKLEVKELGDGHYAAAYELTRPEVEATYILRYNIDRPEFPPRYSGCMTLFQTGRSVYGHMLDRLNTRGWTVVKSGNQVIVELIKELLAETQDDEMCLSLLRTVGEDVWLVKNMRLLARASLASLELENLRAILGNDVDIAYMTGFYPGSSERLRFFKPKEVWAEALFDYPKGAITFTSPVEIQNAWFYFPPGATHIPGMDTFDLPKHQLVFAEYKSPDSESIGQRVGNLFGGNGRTHKVRVGGVFEPLEFLVIE